MNPRLPSQRIGIVHYGEHTPLDTEYRRARMGQLAQWLTEAGFDVTRFVPTYSPFTGTQRPAEWSGVTTDEGTIQMVPTRSYVRSVSRDRFGFLLDFGAGTAARAAALAPFDAMIVGYPPPGVITRLRRSLDYDVPILADIRDLWPDALVPAKRRVLVTGAELLGHGLATELRRADGVVAMSETMLARAPASVRLQAIPHAIPAALAEAASNVDHDRGLRAVFVGTFTQGVDLPALFGGWRHYVGRRPGDSPEPTLVVCGDGERAGEVDALTRDLPGVELLGRVPSSTVGERLAEADIGIAATRPGFGTTFSNKVIEYIGTGLFVLNSLESESAGALDRLGLGQLVPASAEGWAAGFSAAEKRLAELRTSRSERRTTAIENYGRPAIEPLWMETLGRLGLKTV